MSGEIQALFFLHVRQPCLLAGDFVCNYLFSFVFVLFTISPNPGRFQFPHLRIRRCCWIWEVGGNWIIYHFFATGFHFSDPTAVYALSLAQNGLGCRRAPKPQQTNRQTYVVSFRTAGGASVLPESSRALQLCFGRRRRCSRVLSGGLSIYRALAAAPAPAACGGGESVQ